MLKHQCSVCGHKCKDPAWPGWGQLRTQAQFMKAKQSMLVVGCHSLRPLSLSITHLRLRPEMDNAGESRAQGLSIKLEHQNSSNLAALNVDMSCCSPLAG